jgi:amidohydrolase
MPILNRIAAFQPDMTAWRHDLHQHPELGFQEHRTSAVVAEKLRQFGCDEVVTEIARTGVVGVIRGRPGTRAIGLRADMDALPILEETGLPYASTTPGVMHACGHDGHTTMLLGAARYLAETRNFPGTVYVIFQPAEEGLAGGAVMVKEGLFERFPMDMVFGMHNWPTEPEGTFRWGTGPIMAATASFEITVEGRGGHAAHPNDTVDPIVAAAQIVTALQNVVARNVPPTEAAVVSIGHISGGQTHNVIPSTVRMLGTTRWFTDSVGDLLETNLRRTATGIAESLGARAEVKYVRNYIVTVNDEAATELTVRAAEAVAGSAQVQPMSRPTMGAEDFSFMLAAKQGSYIMLGGARGVDEPKLHHPRYDFNDAILPLGASYWATLVEQVLGGQP